MRVSSIPKPKEEKAKAGKYSKFGDNIKIENLTIDGNQGDINWDDLIKITPPPGEEDEEFVQRRPEQTSEDL